MANQSQLVLVGAVYPLHQRGEGVPAGVRRVGVLLLTVHDKCRVFQAQRIQNAVKHGPVSTYIQSSAVWRTKHLPGRFPIGQPIYDRLYLWRDRYRPVFTGFCFCSAHKSSFFGAVILHTKRQ